MNNKDLEKIVLSFLLKDKSTIAQASVDLNPDCFSDENKVLAKIILGYYSKYRSIVNEDVLSIALEKKYSSNPDFILHCQKQYQELRAEDISDKNFSFYLDQLKEYFYSEQLKKVLTQEKGAGTLIKEGQATPAWEQLKKVGFDIERGKNNDRVARVHIQEAAKDERIRYEQVKNDPTKAWGLRTGFQVLDALTRGLEGGELLVVAGRHGAGKSIVALNMGVNAFKQKKNVVLFSLEMPYSQYFHRLHSCYAGLKLDDIIHAKLASEHEQIYTAKLAEMQASENYFYIVDTPKCNALKVEAEMARVLDKIHPDLIVIDYLGIMHPNEHQKSDHEAQAAVVEEVRNIGRIYNLPIVTAVQLNRDPNKKDKTKSTERLSRSDVIGATADIVLQIGESEDDDIITNDMILHIIKNRKGKAGQPIIMYKNFETMSIKDKTNPNILGFEGTPDSNS